MIKSQNLTNENRDLVSLIVTVTKSTTISCKNVIDIAGSIDLSRLVGCFLHYFF